MQQSTGSNSPDSRQVTFNVYNIEVRDCAVALRTTRLCFAIVQVHPLCECVDTKHLSTNHS